MVAEVQRGHQYARNGRYNTLSGKHSKVFRLLIADLPYKFPLVPLV